MINIGYAFMIQYIIYYNIIIHNNKTERSAFQERNLSNGVSKRGLRFSPVLPNQRPEPLEKLEYKAEFSRRDLHGRVEEQRLPANNADGRE